MGLKRFFVFFVMGPCALSQQVFDDTALKQDFEVLTKVVIEVAPTLKVSDKAALYAKLNQRKEALTGASMTAYDFFIFLKNSAFGITVDEHAGIELPQEVIQSLIPNKPALFPLPISIQNKKVLVNHEGVGIPFGSVITSINEHPISEVLDTLMPKVSSRAYRELERQFDLAYFIEYGQNDAFTIGYTAPNTSQTQQVRLEAIDLSTRQSLWEDLVYPLNRAQLKNLTNTWYDDTQKVYYLQLNGFDWRAPTKNETKAFEKEFTRIFKEIANVNPKQLIVDMRYNGGGKMNIPGLFYSFLATAAFSEVVTAKIPDFDLPYMEYIPMGPENKFNAKAVAKNLKELKKTFTLKGDYYENVYINRTLQPHKQAYQGEVSLLISGSTGSAAAYFTALFKSQNRGAIIGEPIGGTHDNITAVKNIPYILPNTKIKTTMPIGILKCSEAMRMKVPEDKIDPDYDIAAAEKYQLFLLKEDWDLKEAYKHFNN